MVVVVDAVDEALGRRDRMAHGEFPVVDTVLAPLVAAAHRTRLRLMIGTRRHLLTALGTPVNGTSADRAVLVDLDDERYADRASVRRYIESCLLTLTPTSPYIGRDRAYLDEVIEALTEAAGHSFLVALITARSLALSSQAVRDPGDDAWQKGLPRKAADAMRDDLDRRLGDQAQRARDLLLPLAYAKGDGLPWEDIWPLLVRELTEQACTSDDLDWLIDEAGYYVTEATTEDGRRSVYRLYHESLAEHLRGQRADTVDDESTIVSRADRAYRPPP